MAATKQKITRVQVILVFSQVTLRVRFSEAARWFQSARDFGCDDHQSCEGRRRTQWVLFAGDARREPVGHQRAIKWPRLK